MDEVWVEDYADKREEGFRFGEQGASSLRTHILNSSRGGDIALARVSFWFSHILWKNLNELLGQPNRIKHEHSVSRVRRGCHWPK